MNDETQQTDARRLEKEEIEDLGTVTLARGGHVIHCLTVIGQIEGHSEAPQGQKTTKYEHVIPQLVAAQEDPRIEGLLVLLNTVGGDVDPVRHSSVILGVPQTMRSFEQMQQRITGFVAAHSGMTEKRYTDLMLHTGELVMDMGTVLDGRRAVKEKLIDELGGLSDALAWLYKEIERK